MSLTVFFSVENSRIWRALWGSQLEVARDALDGELESLPTSSEVEKQFAFQPQRTSCARMCANMREQLNDVDQKKESKRKKIEELVSPERDVAKSIEEEEIFKDSEATRRPPRIED